MKRQFSFTIILALILSACSGGDSEIDNGSSDTRKPGRPNGKGGDAGSQSTDGGSQPGTDASVDAGGDGGASLRDGGSSADGSAGGSDASTPDSSASDSGTAGGFEGRWTVTLTATDDTTCSGSGSQSFSREIQDSWVFTGSVFTGEHIGPNPLERAAGTDVWNLGETLMPENLVATADLALNGTNALSGTFVFYRDVCDVFYDVAGMRAR